MFFSIFPFSIRNFIPSTQFPKKPFFSSPFSYNLHEEVYWLMIMMMINCSSNRRRRSNKSKFRAHLITFMFFILNISMLLGKCEGIRSTNEFIFNSRPRYSNSGQFLGFFPKRFPVHSSGPSRKHNDLGLQNWRSP